MLIAVAVQSALVGVVALATGAFYNWTSAAYVVLGAAVVLIPSGLLAVRLAIRQRHQVGAHPATFLIDEFVRVALTVVLMVTVVRVDAALRWLPFLIGLIVAVKAVYGLMLLPSRGVQGGDKAAEKTLGPGAVSGRS